LQSKNRSGKTLLSVPDKANVLSPCLVRDINTDLLVAISNEGRLLVFALSELPELAKGKGNKIMNIPAARLQAREEYMAYIGVVSKGQQLLVYSGKRHTALKGSDFDEYRGERGRRGNKLPRGFQNVDRIEIADR
jgi:topoisomerase-4 subunit A